MAGTPAFALGATTSSFTNSRVHSSTAPVCDLRPRTVSNRATVTMEDKKSIFQNPFAKKPADEKPAAAKPAPKAVTAGVKDTLTKAAEGTTKLPVVGGIAKRGLDLLREDLFKSAPERAGVGRQDTGAIMMPMAGEPGYKPAAYQTVYVSELGISPFPDDKNAVGKVGGVNAVKKAALEVKEGKKKASDVKNSLLKIETVKEPEVYDIPDYLKPLPEDTPRKGYSWKNYIGR